MSCQSDLPNAKGLTAKQDNSIENQKLFEFQNPNLCNVCWMCTV